MEEKKKVSKKQQACVNRYMSTHYDRINLTVPKGTKEKLQAHATRQNESVNAFINRAITETVARDVEREEECQKA